MRYLFPVVLAALYMLVGCAAEVMRYPVTIKSVESISGADLKTVRQDAPVTFNSGYGRVVRKNSTWKLVGGISQGKVYVSADGTFSVEGAHVHEAYLVVNKGNLVGFYLPVERSFAPLTSNHVVSLWEE